MSTPNSQDPAPEDDLLAPPPAFGVAEPTGPQLLPINTTMSEVLDGDSVAERLPEPPIEPIADVVEEAEAVAEEASLAAAPVAVSAVDMDIDDEPPRQSLGITVVFAVGVGLILGWSGWYFFIRGDDSPPTAPAVASNTLKAQNGVVPKAGGSPSKAVPANAAKVPVTREDFERMTLKERHAFLAGPDVGEFDIELHVGLDLVQAEQAPRPCRTFADAMSTIEASEDHSDYDWALAKAVAPMAAAAGREPGEESGTCEGLDERLARLKGDAAKEPAAAPPAAPPRQRTKTRKTRNRPSTPKVPEATSPPPETPSPSAAAAEPPAEPKAPTKRPNIAGKIDDELHE